MLDNPLVRNLLEFLYQKLFLLYWPLYRVYKSQIDRAERRWIAASIPRGGVIVDIGANVGVYAKFFAQVVGPQGRVFAFEPDPKNFSHLRDLADVTPSISAYPYAAGDFTGVIGLFQSKGFNFDHRTFASPSDDFSVDVSVIRLDECSDLWAVPIDRFKIDVQGSELSVLKGAEGLLAKNPGAYLLVEYAPWGLVAAGCSPEDFIDFVRSLGYRIFSFGANRDVLLEGIDNRYDRYWYRNLILSRDSFVTGLLELHYPQGGTTFTPEQP